MPNQLQCDYLSVLEVKTKEDLEAHVVHFTHKLGFQTVTAMTVVDHVSGNTEFFCIDNGPAAYQHLAEDLSRAKLDPVMQHCKHKSLPIVWNRDTYLEAGCVHKWEEQAPFGYCCGIGLALHLPNGLHFALSVDRDQSLPSDPEEVTRMTAALQLYAVHAQEAASRVLLPAAGASVAPSLTARELETLRWTMEGKTAWEVGRILGIAEDTVVRHTQSASHKLGCSSKHHAVVKALRLGLIQ